MVDSLDDVFEARANYIRIRREEVQNSIINYRTCTSSTSGSDIWTFRNTGCDIVSVVTTTTPIKNGVMKDVRLHNKEMRRIKPPASHAPGKIAPGNPLEVTEQLDGDQEKIRLKNCLMLRKERDAFMKKLEASRAVRSTIESNATIFIQKVYRGRYVRKHMDSIRHMCLKRREAHGRVKSIISQMCPGMVLTGMQFRTKYLSQRYRCAQIIQCCFRRYISRRVLRNKSFERLQSRRRQAVIRVQCFARATAAKARVKLIKQRAYLSHTRKSAVMIQKHVRRLFARRLVRKRRYKLQWLAARLIQGWYRSKKAKIKSIKIKQIVVQRKLWLGAEGMQCLVRRKIARSRVNRIRLRRLYLFLFTSATTIQTMIRKFLSRCYVRRVRKEKRDKQVLLQKEEQRLRQKEIALAELNEARALLEGADIFSQARVGNAISVDDIYSGKLSDEAHKPNELNAQKDTVLTIAAANGFVDIVRKCFQWNFDFNHRNANGMTALMLAVQNNHLEVAQYILAPPVKFKLDRFTESDAAFLLVQSLENQVQLRIKSKNSMYSLEMFKALMNQVLPVTGKDQISGTTALHSACGLGDIECFRLLLKSKAKHDLIDDVGQLPLHRACTSSLDIVKMLLGFDSSAGILIPASKRAPILLIKDADGKDCRLYSAINGQTQILEFCQEIVKSNKEVFNSIKKVKDDIGWTPDDFSSVLRLAQRGNVACFAYLIECGFDPLWPQPDTGVTVFMEACLNGQLVFIDYLLKLKLDLLSNKDNQGRTAIHYAAQCTTEMVVPYLLSHENAGSSNIIETSLAMQDNNGLTPLHIAAIHGIVIKVDLLAPRGLAVALSTKDKKGLTPLAAAARSVNLDFISHFLTLGASAKDVDNEGRSVLWHLFHPEKQASGIKLVASELRSRLGIDSKLAKNIREANAVVLAQEIKVITELIQAGCSLYRNPTVTAEELLASPYKSQRDPDAALTENDLLPYCPGDILVHELSFTALNAVLDIASVSDCWRLLLSSIRFDDGAGKTFVALFEGGAADRLAGVSPLRKAMSKDTVSQLGRGVMFGGLSLAGWCIRLGNSNLLQRLYKKGINPSLPADIRGDSCLHVIARHGTIAMVDVTLNCEQIVIEALNAQGNTAMMEAAKVGNFHIAKRLAACRASARRGLAGKYWGWLLAFARKQESTQVNLQTGRVGDDDVKYFAAPEPCWYEQAMDSTIVSKKQK